MVIITLEVDWISVESWYCSFFECRNNMLFGHTEMLCSFTSKTLGVTSTIMYILMLEGSFMFLAYIKFICLYLIHDSWSTNRWYGVLGILDVAIKHLLEVIACSHQSLITQNMFLSDFFHYVQVLDHPFLCTLLYLTFSAFLILWCCCAFRAWGRNLMYTSFNSLFLTCHRSELYMKIIAPMHRMQM